MLYFLYFLVGGTIMVLALLLSQSKYFCQASLQPCPFSRLLIGVCK